MRVDCFNACQSLLAEVTVGDTFYYEGALYLKASAYDAGILPFAKDEECLVVDLARGVVEVLKSDTLVAVADTKIVCC